jgi:tripartite-type tricarboxylate transporter receptor subunit TctC
VTDKMSWADIPTCKEGGLDVDYLMLRGIFMPGDVKQEHVDYYVGLFKRVRETPEWKSFMEQGAFNQTALAGKEYADWVAKEEARHVALMKGAGFIAK